MIKAYHYLLQNLLNFKHQTVTVCAFFSNLITNRAIALRLFSINQKDQLRTSLDIKKLFGGTFIKFREFVKMRLTGKFLQQKNFFFLTVQKQVSLIYILYQEFFSKLLVGGASMMKLVFPSKKRNLTLFLPYCRKSVKKSCQVSYGISKFCFLFFFFRTNDTFGLFDEIDDYSITQLNF